MDARRREYAIRAPGRLASVAVAAVLTWLALPYLEPVSGWDIAVIAAICAGCVPTVYWPITAYVRKRMPLSATSERPDP